MISGTNAFQKELMGCVDVHLKEEGCQNHKGGFQQPQIQKYISQRKKETLMTYKKTQHVDGSNSYPQVEAFRIWRLVET